MPNAIESERLLLVEGNDHRNFFEAFRDHLAIPEMQIENYGGVSQLSGVLAAYASSQDPMVGVLVLPDDGPGMLETVLARCFAETREDDCIHRFFECVEADGRTILRSEKARTCAYLATTRDPYVSVGVAAKKGVWDFEHAAFSKVGEFLSRLGAP